MTVVVWNAYRLEKWNGYFSLSPQIAGNVAVGDAIRLGSLDAFAVGEDGKRVRLFSEPLREGGAAAAWLQSPGTRVFQFFENLWSNLRFAVRATLGTLARLPTSVALLLCLMLILGMRNFTSFQLPLLVPSLLFALVHLASYSVFMSWRRYAEQAVPWMILGLAPLILVAIPVGFFRLWASVDRTVHWIRLGRRSGKRGTPAWNDFAWILAAAGAVAVPPVLLVLSLIHI